MMYVNGPIILYDVEREVSRKEVTLDVNDEESKILSKIKDMLIDTNEPKIISLVEVDEKDGLFKIVSCHKFNRLIQYQNIDHNAYFWIENYLRNYGAYLDYLYMNGVKEVDELSVCFADFEAMLKAIMCFYDTVPSKSEDHPSLIKVTNRETNSLIFYTTDYTRPTFDDDFLERIEYDLNKKLKESRNKPGVIDVAKMLKKEPRPNLRINSRD